MKIGKIQDVLRRSSRAVCGPMEREIVVEKENVGATKRLLKSKGFFIVGTSENGSRKTRRIWFNPTVSL